MVFLFSCYSRCPLSFVDWVNTQINKHGKLKISPRICYPILYIILKLDILSIESLVFENFHLGSSMKVY